MRMEHKTPYYQRWNLQHRLQHLFLFISMFGLILSGLAIKYYGMAWAQLMFRVTGGFHNNLVLHKASASLLVAVSVWHLGYLLVTWAKDKSHPKTWAMMPTLDDARHVWQHMLYLLNLRKEPPAYDRYTYLEKFEYLSIFWGMVVMGMTGFSLWFPARAAAFVPRLWLDAFRILHGNEALVATIALVYGHFFTVHFNPGVFPTSKVWINGKISLEHMLEEHPLEYQRLMGQGELPAVLAGAQAHALPAWRRWLGVVELVIYSAIFYYMLLIFLPKALA